MFSNLLVRLQQLPIPAQIAGVGYAIVAVFGLTVVGLRHLDTGLSGQEEIVVGLLASGPLALALIWERLTGLKLFSVEVAFASATVKVAPPDTFSSSFELEMSGLSAISNAILFLRRTEGDLVELNLHYYPYWWSTRLFLLAAMAQDFTRIQRIVFVEGDRERTFVGMVSPSMPRREFARRFPDYEAVYSRLRPINVAEELLPAAVGNTGIVWWQQSFDAKKPTLYEKETTEIVSREELQRWLDVMLEKSAVEWRGGAPTAWLYRRVLKARDPYVALTRDGRLQEVVSRLELAAAIASQVLKQHIEL